MSTMFHVSSFRNRSSDNGSGFFYLPGRISLDRITLVQQDLVGGDLC